jgi:glycyl-radical enzyme activating protein
MKQDMSAQVKGIVFDIMKFAIHDGPGIRTTVFLKGCPLSCLWCHNPESKSGNPEISYVAEKCISCGRCMQACPNDCHKNISNEHIFDRSECVRCGRCSEKCPTQALEIIGKEMSVAEVIDEVIKDKSFYDNTGGGVTFSGGEPMFQFEFILELLKEAKKCGLHVCMETCGYAPVEHYTKTLPYVDTYLFDIKETDPDKHLEYTGVSLKPIIKILEFLNSHHAEIILRCPLIPGLNTREEHLKEIGILASGLQSVTQVEVMPYKPLGLAKCERIGRDNLQYKEKSFPPDSDVKQWIESIKSQSSKPVLQA